MIQTGCQIRAARALAGWTRQELAIAAGLHRQTIRYWEMRKLIPPPLLSGRRNREPVACRRMREAFERVGLEFIAKPGPGVCIVRG